MSLSAELLMGIGGVCAFLLTLNWVRKRDLREKYAVIWIGVASVMLLVGIFPDLIKSFAEYAHLSYAVAVLFPSLSIMYLFAFFVSVSLSRQYRRNARLVQEIALLELRVKNLEELLQSSSKA